MNRNVHWLVQTASDLPEHDHWLSGWELQVLAGMRFAKRRRDWKLGRWTAKKAVCAFWHKKEDAVLSSMEIRAAEDGSPVLFCNQQSENLSLSLSHSWDKGLCVIGPGDFALGCDLEFIEGRDEKFIEDYFTREEIELIQRCGDEKKPLAANLIWSAKESVLKVLREGLRRDARSLSIHADLSAPESLWNPWAAQCLISSRVFWGWWRTSGSYVYTVASDQPVNVPEPLGSE